MQIRDYSSDAKAVFIRDEPRWPKCDVSDVMIGRYGASVGKILTGKAGAYNVALVKMIIDEGVHLRKFIYYWLQSETFQNSFHRISRSAQNGFNKEDLSEIEVPKPDLNTQANTVEKIEHAFTWLDKIAAEHARAAHLLPRLDQAILAKAFRGDLVPQDPNDEPASALLARIKAERGEIARPLRRAGKRT